MIPWVRLAAVGAVAVGLFGAGWAVNGWRLASQIAALKQKSAEQIAANHRLEAMWSAHVIKLGDEANAEAERLRAALARAAAAGRSLLDAGSRHAAAAASAPGTSEAAAAAIALHAELRRRADEAAGILAAHADAARAAGLACERFDAVTR